MVSMQLFLGYLALVFTGVLLVGLCCLSLSCHVTLGKCIGCVWNATERCFRARNGKREQEAPVLAERRHSRNVNGDPPCGACLRSIPWLLTCGYCCGNYGDIVATRRQRGESAGAAVRQAEGQKPAVVVGQPVFKDANVDRERAVTVSVPLLAMS
ncbi:MAG: hypothetical protein CMI29_08375 [Opitutae bacterium]|nr:hypothetical protein [Opitutae bacterium]